MLENVKSSDLLKSLARRRVISRHSSKYVFKSIFAHLAIGGVHAGREIDHAIDRLEDHRLQRHLFLLNVLQHRLKRRRDRLAKVLRGGVVKIVVSHAPAGRVGVLAALVIRADQCGIGLSLRGRRPIRASIQPPCDARRVHEHEIVRRLARRLSSAARSPRRRSCTAPATVR